MKTDDPASVSEAVTMRAEIISEVIRLQGEASKLNLELKQTWPHDVFTSLMKRKKAIGAALQVALEKQRRLKLWILNHPESRNGRNLADDTWDGSGVLELARGAIGDLWTYVSWLENKVKTLQAENAELRDIKF